MTQILSLALIALNAVVDALIHPDPIEEQIRSTRTHAEARTGPIL